MLYYWLFQITSLLYLSVSALPLQNLQLNSDVSPTVYYDPCSTEVYQSGSQWPNGIIPYKFNPNVPDTLRTAVYVALQAVENTSCVQFLPQTVQSEYVHIYYGERCCSYTGKVGNAQQLLYVSEICINENETLSDTITEVTGIIADDECESICGGSILVAPGTPGTYGVIESPGSERYPPNKDCLWKLWLSENETLQLKFVEFDLEQGEFCNYDYLNIIEEDFVGNLLSNTKLCGSHLISMNSTANVVSVHFHSDSDIEAGGFKLIYFIHDVLCAVNNGGCSQICISDEQGYKTGCGCYAGFELSYDETSCEDINECLAKICHQRCKNTYGSYYCHCSQGYGLSADLKTCIKCGGYYNTSSAVISSPRYPSNYPPYQNCLWTITIWPGHYLNITIKHLEIVETNRCSLHYLRPAEGNFRYRRRLCGTQTNIQYILHKKSNTSFRFVSKANIASQQHTGFELAYEQVPIASLTPVQLDTVYANGSPIPYSSYPWL